ncbi:MAG: O-antigen ligase family protein [Candidatus Omnitrophica bacterium]|nr:O-antigen ligase family protein [Candidatus Omnitrophota bacterium]MDD5435948.1 O-antigen ligase family protein [Candidatus Omnitrophota bacterium]
MKTERLVFFLDKIAAWSLYIIIFTLPFSKSIVEISIAVGIVSIVAKKILARERILVNTHIEIFLYIFVAASLISIFNTQTSQLALSARAFFSKTLKFAALFLITKEIINTREKLSNFIMIAALSCAVMLVDAFAQYFITHEDFLHKYTSFLYTKEWPNFRGFPTASFPFPNDFAAWMLVFIFPAFAFALFVKGDIRKNVIGSVLFAALLYFLIITKVRGAWAAFFFSFILLCIVKLKRIGWLLLLVIVVMAGALNMEHRLLSMASVNDRSVMWKNSTTILMRHPVIGNGLNTFYDNYMKVREDKFRDSHGSYAHNCYLQMAAEIGLVGLIAFLVFVISVLYNAFRSLAYIKDSFYYSIVLGAGLGLSAFLIHSAVDTSLYSLPLAALFWLSLGILSATINISKIEAGT